MILEKLKGILAMLSRADDIKVAMTCRARALAVDHDPAPEKWLSTLSRSISKEPDHGIYSFHAKIARLQDGNCRLSYGG